MLTFLMFLKCKPHSSCFPTSTFLFDWHPVCASSSTLGTFPICVEETLLLKFILVFSTNPHYGHWLYLKHILLYIINSWNWICLWLWYHYLPNYWMSKSLEVSSLFGLQFHTSSHCPNSVNANSTTYLNSVFFFSLHCYCSSLGSLAS